MSGWWNQLWKVSPLMWKQNFKHLKLQLTSWTQSSDTFSNYPWLKPSMLSASMQVANSCRIHSLFFFVVLYGKPLGPFLLAMHYLSRQGHVGRAAWGRVTVALRSQALVTLTPKRPQGPRRHAAKCPSLTLCSSSCKIRQRHVFTDSVMRDKRKVAGLSAAFFEY